MLIICVFDLVVILLYNKSQQVGLGLNLLDSIQLFQSEFFPSRLISEGPSWPLPELGRLTYTKMKNNTSLLHYIKMIRPPPFFLLNHTYVQYLCCCWLKWPPGRWGTYTDLYSPVKFLSKKTGTVILTVTEKNTHDHYKSVPSFAALTIPVTVTMSPGTQLSHKSAVRWHSKVRGIRPVSLCSPAISSWTLK